VKKAFPALGFMRYPVKFVMLPAAVVPLLAATFIGRALSRDERGWLKLRRVIIALGGAMIVASALIIWAAYQFPFKGTEPKDALWSGLSRIVVLMLFIAALCSLRQPARAKVARFAVLLLLFLDVRTAGPRPNPTAERFVYDPFLATHELHLDPKPSPGDGRAMLDATAESNLSVTQMTNGVNDVLYRRFALRGNLNILDDIPKLVGMYPLYFRETGEILPLLYTVPQPPGPLMDFLSVSYTNLPGRVTQWGFRSTHLPWITAGQKPVFADGPATLAALAQPDFDPRKSVFLAPEARGNVTVSNASSAQVSLRRFSGNRIEFEVDAAEPAMVVLAQSFYHNWRAEVNGKGVPVLRANHAFEALEVPAGHQQVVLRYQDRFFLVGAGISIVCALAWVAAWLAGRRATKSSPIPTRP
jgi:hypothetical protein